MIKSGVMYSLKDIEERIMPIVVAYNLQSAYLFDSWVTEEGDDNNLSLAISVRGLDLSDSDISKIKEMLQAQFDCPLRVLILDNGESMLNLDGTHSQQELVDSFLKRNFLFYVSQDSLLDSCAFLGY